MSIRKITVAGGGTLGTQAALQFALHGKNVLIYGRNEDSVDRAKTRLARFTKIYEEETEFDDSTISEASNSLRFTTDPEVAFAGPDLIFECITEELETKRKFFASLGKYIQNQETIIATNTSTLLPSVLAESFEDNSRFLAIHLANEIWKRNTAEIMPHNGTTEGLVDTVAEFATEVGLLPVPLKKEQPGYLLNSVMIPWIRAGLDLAAGGVAEPQNIDKVWETVMGSDGPFRVIDVIGLRTTVAVLSLEAKHGVPGAEEIVAYLKKNYVEQNRLGVENGKGFYDYS